MSTSPARDGASDLHSDAASERAGDRFYRGTLVRVQAGGRHGILRTGSGRDLPFDVSHVRLLGAPDGFQMLREGMRVGFDVGRTSRGLWVTTIRVFESDDGSTG